MEILVHNMAPIMFGALVLFLLVLPIVVYNIRVLNQQKAIR